jgi:hypothetical protein
MKKALVLMAVIVLFVPCIYAGVMGTINDDVEKMMRQINSSGKTGQNVQEIKFKRKTNEPAAAATETPVKIGFIGTLSALNITAGIFEGGILGMTVGLVGYSQSLNRNINPVIYGSVIGTITGAVAAAGLSVAETITGRYSMSDDYGLDIFGGMLVGVAIGSAAGVLNWQRTGHMENVSEGAGYGVTVGALGGLAVAIAETFMPESLRGGGGTYDTGSHASLIAPYCGTTVLCYNFKY